MAYSDENKILIKHINALSIHSYTHREIKIGALKCNLFVFSSICAEYLQKFEFLISRGNVAMYLR